VYRTQIRAPVRRLAGAAGRLNLGWLGWLAIAFTWLLVIALLRANGAVGTPIGVAQLPPTVALVLAFALLLELGSAAFGPAAGDNATGVAVALALVRALDTSPTRRLDVELVLEGSGEGGRIGLRRYLRARRGSLTTGNTILLGVAPSGAGELRWWVSDGPLVPLRFSERLVDLCAALAAREPSLVAQPHIGRGSTPAHVARTRRLPAIAIGCLDQRGLVPRSHQPTDITEQIDPAALDGAVEFSLMLVDAIDASLMRTRNR
jgi:hypothetical protein